MFRCLLVLFIALLACGCHRAAVDRSAGDAGARSKLEADANLDIYEAALRHQIAAYSAEPNLPRVFYVSLDGDPPAAFLNRFAGGPSRVEPMSRYGGVKEAGVVLVTLYPEIERWDDGHVQVSTLAHYANVELDCGTSYPIGLVRKNDGTWTSDRR